MTSAGLENLARQILDLSWGDRVRLLRQILQYLWKKPTTFEPSRIDTPQVSPFEQRFGTLTLDEPCNFDNESIDADLARAYARDLEP
ncbi:MAG: hypothetical protein MH825_00910 [Cyanobacteria bacterium]|nr:hypothetical protein [Cyanobacteriota bacterium]